MKKQPKIRITHNTGLLKIILFLVVIFIILIAVIVFNRPSVDEPDSDKKVIDDSGKTIDAKSCNQNSDCVPSSCCHPTECVSRDNIPDCSGRFCSTVCSGPLDCGAGSCGCVDSKCSIISKR